MTDISSCKTCRYFDSKDWNSEDKNWCRYNDMPAINEGLCGHYEPMIKPCPFCGGTDIHIVENGPDGFSITCKDCNAWVDNMFEDMTKEQAIELWNRRVNE